MLRERQREIGKDRDGDRDRQRQRERKRDGCRDEGREVVREIWPQGSFVGKNSLQTDPLFLKIEIINFRGF